MLARLRAGLACARSLDIRTKELPEDPEATPASSTADTLGLFTPLDRTREIAILAVVATVVGRAFAPAMRGVVTGAGPWVDRIAFVGNVASQLLLLTLVWLLIAVTMAVLRLTRLPLAYRLLATGLAGIVLGLATPATVSRLSPEFNSVLALTAVTTAMLGSAQALVAPHTRIVGVLLALGSLAALTRQTSWMMALYGGEHALLRLALAARWVATGALVLSAMGIATALLWLVTRRSAIASLCTSISTGVALYVAWLAERDEDLVLPEWKLAIGRAASRLLAPPLPHAPVGMRVFLAVSALLLAIVALSSRRQPGVVVGTMALVLVAGTDADVPLCALALAVASLAAALAAHDPRVVSRGMPALLHRR